ncbi:MAG: hypothetical protein Q7S63_00695 [bacterium]|nr:hypothetical protein [bacterium]
MKKTFFSLIALGMTVLCGILVGIFPTPSLAATLPECDARCQMVNHLYQEVLGREADSGGLQYFYASGGTEDQIRKNLCDSSEGRSLGKPRKGCAFPTPQDVQGLGDIEAAVALYNLHRVSVGSAPVPLDEELSRGAYFHVLYMLKNPSTRGHYEDPTLPGYTKEGAIAAQSSSLSWGEKTAAECVQALISVPYHRLRFLSSEVRSVQLGFKDSACVFGVESDSQTRSGEPTVSNPIVYPANNQADVPLKLPSGETPDPLKMCRDSSGQLYTHPAGFAITVEFQSFARGIHVANSSLRDANGQYAEHCVINAEEPHPDHNTILAPGNVSNGWSGAIMVIPRVMLAAGMQYTLRLAGDYSGQPFDITTAFTARGSKVPGLNAPAPNFALSFTDKRGPVPIAGKQRFRLSFKMQGIEANNVFPEGFPRQALTGLPGNFCCYSVPGEPQMLVVILAVDEPPGTYKVTLTLPNGQQASASFLHSP